MKATETTLLDFLKGPKQFLIPIYQRTYSWTQRQCTRLWDDILRAATHTDTAGHFIGSVVYIEKGLYHISTIPQFLIIDGQQRLTTLTLLICALSRAIQRRHVLGEVTHTKLVNYYLLNNDEDGLLRYKLLLTQSDQAALCSLLDTQTLPEHAPQHIADNYRYFTDRLEEPSLDLLAVYRGITRLFIVDIALNREHDNPQLIFESLNATGLELSQADLIRNYVLMGLEPTQQDSLYRRYWHPMQERFAGHGDEGCDRYLRDYLTVKTRRIPHVRGVYEAFKVYVHQLSDTSVPDVVADIATYSGYFAKLAFNAEADSFLKELFGIINSLRMDVAYPLLLDLYNEYAQHTLSRTDFLKILETLESYVFRRQICGLPNTNTIFVTLMRELDRRCHCESLCGLLASAKKPYHFPTDDEFTNALLVNDIYNSRHVSYLLSRIENSDRKERVNVKEYTVEHIMPQNENLNSTWRDDLGVNWREIQSRFVHTLGNLTLTAYNSELSDRPFIHKREMVGGFADSPIRLNKGLGMLDHWNEEEIVRRGRHLAQLARQVWSYPSLTPDVLQRYQKRKRENVGGVVYTLDDHTWLTDDNRYLFDELRTRILELDSSIKETVLKEYIAYTRCGSLAKVYPRKVGLHISIAVNMGNVDDPRRACRRHRKKGQRERVQLKVISPEGCEYASYIIKQALQTRHIRTPS